VDAAGKLMGLEILDASRRIPDPAYVSLHVVGACDR
jgi:hypothetical protein